MNSTSSSNGARVSETPNCVIDYIVERLAEGIAHCFGLAGDYHSRYATPSTAAQKSSGSGAPTNGTQPTLRNASSGNGR
jgi:hypothetical protein